MKGALTVGIFCLASLYARVAADIFLDPFPDVVNVGKTYTLTWTATDNYTYTLWLVSENAGDNEYSWDKVAGLATGLEFNSLNCSYTWTVPSNLTIEWGYALWLDGLSIPFDGESDTTITDWFAISSSNTTTTSGSASPTAVATPSSTSSGNPSSTSSESSNNTPSNVHHQSLSGGAIAGIVIGCLLAVGIVIGAIAVFLRRRKHAGVEKREAAARANRLEPVMQEGTASYEMHNRMP